MGRALSLNTIGAVCIGLLLLPVVAWPQDQQASPDSEIAEIELLPPVTTEHSIEIGSATYSYEATVGYYIQRDEKENPLGYFFYTAYRLKDGGAERPLTFVFNGGPGSSSIYLHMLTVGPKIAVLDEEGNTPGPPPTFKDNQHSWLPFTDLVFIDPIGTGFSFPHPGSDTKHYWGAHADARSVADFIRMYLTDNARWLSPIFIAGESYGGIRGALLAKELHENRRIKLNISGLIFISPVFDRQSKYLSKHNPQYLSQYLPTMAATAWHHQQVDRSQFESFDAFIDEVVAWSLDDYLVALTRGDRLSQAEYDAVADRLARYTGLDREYIVQEDLRLLSYEFRQKLMAHERMSLDRLDARWETGAYELTTTLSPVLNHYIREELGYATDRAYTVSGNVRPWPQDVWWGEAFSVVDELSEIMHNNRQMKVLSTAGYYDYACPFITIDYAYDQLLLKEELRDNIIRKYYQAGHMVYTPQDELERFTSDVRQFYNSIVN